MEAREYQKAIDCLCGLIEDGQLTVGDKLPTERALAEQLGISRNSTREALRALENLGVVERRQGSGSYLVGNTTKTIQPMIDMMLLLGQTSQLEICAFRRNMEKAVILAVLEKYHVGTCCYGHLHGPVIKRRMEGRRGETDFSLISADYLGFVPKKICE